MSQLLPTRAVEVLRALAPERYLVRRARRHGERLRRGLRVPELNASFASEFGRSVRRGPFAGLDYPPAMVRDVDGFVAKLVGAAELELYPLFEEVIRSRPSTIVNVGSSEGFYSVGLARECPDAVVHAFDIDALARRRCSELAAHNGVAARVEVHGKCTAQALRTMPLAGAFVLSDCEGAEVDIFDDEAVRDLGTATVLIEIHPRPGMNVHDLLTLRFAASHEPEVIRPQSRNDADFPEVAGLSEQERSLALAEFRHDENEWIVLRPRRGSAPH